MLQQCLRLSRKVLRSNRKPLPQLYGSRLVVQSCKQYLHGALNLCTELNTFAAHTLSIARKTSDDTYTARRPRNPLLRRTNNRTTYSPHIRNESHILGSAK